MTLDRAIEVSVHGFAAGKSVFYPYTVRDVSGLYHLADAPPRKGARKQEVFAVDRRPEEVCDLIQAAGIEWHFLCDVAPAGADLQARKAAYKALGYRALATEWVFGHDLRDIPTLKSDPPVRLVRTAEEWASLPHETRQRQRWTEAFRQYAIWDADRAYGWAQSRQHEQYAYTSDLHVPEAHRRRGFGRALMSQLLRDDRERGLEGNALIASSAGARLYPHLGFELLGALQILCPARRTA